MILLTNTAALPVWSQKSLQTPSPLLDLPVYDQAVLLHGEGARLTLVAALEDEEYQTATGLPEDLCAHLYPELLTYGPAYADIQRLYSRMIATDNLGEANTTKEGIRRLGVGKEPQVSSIVAWSRNENLDLTGRFVDLALKLKTERRIPNWDREFPKGFIYMCWLLTGQYLFPAELIEKTKTDCLLADNALNLLSLPPLTGRLSDAER